jgi:hypothetical protein
VPASHLVRATPARVLVVLAVLSFAALAALALALAVGSVALDAR